MSFVEFVMSNNVTITLNTSFPTPVSAVALANKLAFTSTIVKMKLAIIIDFIKWLLSITVVISTTQINIYSKNFVP
jgi:hypothetical protein